MAGDAGAIPGRGDARFQGARMADLVAGPVLGPLAARSFDVPRA